MNDRPALEPVLIRSRLGKIWGWRNDTVAFFDSSPNEKGSVRRFILLEEGVQLAYEPWVGEAWRDCWYVDVVAISAAKGVLDVTDLFADVIIGREGPTFRVIDLDDLATALEAGALTAAEAAGALRSLQSFLDNHLQVRQDFPPALITDLTGSLTRMFHSWRSAAPPAPN